MAANIPEDLRTLKEFPVFDASFQDGPCFRQHLSHWALKTDKIATAMTNLANSLENFHNSGQEHYKSAVNMVQSMQEMAGLCGNSTGSSIATPLQHFSDELSRIWEYYNAFLQQNELLHIGPMRELANSFVNLKKLYDELLYYRKEYVSCSEKLCSCRHLSNLPDKSTFNSLTESCYSAQKTYRLVLSKYLTLLRQAHTKDMTCLLNRVMEQVLSLFAYYNNSSQVLKELESEVNDLQNKTKEWDSFFDKELLLWGKLHTSVQRHIMAEFQFNIGLLSPKHSAELTWGDSRESSSIKHPRKHVNIVAPLSSNRKLSPSEDCSTKFQRASSASDLKPSNHKQYHPTPPRAASSPHMDPDSVFDDSMKADEEDEEGETNLDNHKMVRSNSNSDMCDNKCVKFKGDSDDSDSSSNLLARNSALHNRLKNITLAVREDESLSSDQTLSQEMTESAAEEFLSLTPQSPTHHHNHTFSSKISAVINRKNKHKKDKETKEAKKTRKSRKFSGSTENVLEEKEAPNGMMGGTNPGSNCSLPSPLSDSAASPSLGRKGTGIFKRSSRQKLKDNSPSPLDKEGSSKEPSVSPPAPQSTHTQKSPMPLTNGGRVFSFSGSKKALMSRSFSDHIPIVSNPTLIRKEPEMMTFDLQRLIKPVNENWIKSGYLWLRMKLPNNHYAWTHIYCLVDKQKGELMIQEQSLPYPRRLENLMLCNTRPCTPDYIDRNYCFRVISPCSEHLFQSLSDGQMMSWVKALQETTEEVLKNSASEPRSPRTDVTQSQSADKLDGNPVEYVSNALELILNVPGNSECADCSSTTDLEWTSLNLGIVICIKCSGVHRGLGVHVSKVRSLNLDKWDKASVEFMQSQGNAKSNSYYEATLGTGLFEEDIQKPSAKASKDERWQFIQMKYVALAFVPESDDRVTVL